MDASVLIIVIIKFRRLFLHFISIHCSSVWDKIKCFTDFKMIPFNLGALFVRLSGDNEGRLDSCQILSCVGKILL